MKFKLVENLLEDIKEEHQEEQRILDEVRFLFQEHDFDEQKKLNGVAFVKSINTDYFNIEAQMYIDTSNFSYSCYLSSDDEINTSNFSSKGEFDNIIKAANRLVSELNNI